MSLDAKRILIPISDSTHSQRAFRWACHMAQDAKATLHAVHVIEVPLSLSLEDEVAEDIDRAEKLLEKYEAFAKEEGFRGLQARCLRSRQAGAAVVRESEIEQSDLIIVGISYHRSLGQSDPGEYRLLYIPACLLPGAPVAGAVPVSSLTGI